MSELENAQANILKAIEKNAGSGLTGYTQGGSTFQLASLKDLIEGYRLLKSITETETPSAESGVTYAEVVT